MPSDSFMQALQSRRGKGIDPSMIMAGGPDASHEIAENKGIDVRNGFSAGQSVGVEGGEVGIGETEPAHPAIDSRIGVNGADHSDGKDPKIKHTDESTHIPPVGETGPMGSPASQSVGMGGGDLAEQLREHVAGHASQNEYDQLKGMRPRSLGERAKMDVLKSKYEPVGK